MTGVLSGIREIETLPQDPLGHTFKPLLGDKGAALLSSTPKPLNP